MCSTIPLLPNIPSWCGTYLSTGTTLQVQLQHQVNKVGDMLHQYEPKLNMAANF